MFVKKLISKDKINSYKPSLKLSIIQFAYFERKNTI
jgi:hypothetical protein